MTVSVKRNKVQYTGDNSTTAFSVTFPYTETSQVKVYLGSTLQTITTHYTLTDPGATGTVNFLTPPGTGVNVSLIRETDYLQGVDYVNNDALDAETLEKAFDKLTMMAQQLDAKIDGAVGFDETVAGTTSLKLASDATDLAGKLLAFDDSGNFVTTQEIGTFRGSDTTTTTAAYVVRDLIRDSSNDNVYFTKVDAPSGTLLTNTSYFELLVDVATVRTLKVAAETARTGAETAETNAAASLASFQGQYKSAATNPYGGAEDEGDLWYDETANILKYYNGTSFEPVTTSLASVTGNYLTISNQVITAGTVPVSLGGTGSTTASAARSALGVDAAGTDNSTDVTLAGSLDYLTISGQAITRNAIDLTTDVTGALPVANGGTGATSASAARTALGVDAAGTDNSTDVTLATVTGNYLSISGQAITAGTVPVTLGGTGATTASAARSALGVDAAGTDNSTAVTLASVTGNYLTLSGQEITAGTVPVTLGGTGSTTASAARTALGVDAAGTDNSTNVTLASVASNYLSLSGQEITAGTVPVALGGTGSTTASAARTALGLGTAATTASTDYATAAQGTLADSATQPGDNATTLNVSATDKLLGRSTSGAGAVEEIALTAAGRALLDDADTSAQRTTLGLGTAATSATGDFEASGSVSTHAAVTSSVHGISSFGATLVDDADAATARTTLGLGTAATTASTDYATVAQGSTADSALQDVVDDSTPQLGGNLDVNGNSIVSASAGNIAITPDTTGKIILDGLSWPTADGSADQVLKTDGSGNLSFVDQSGGGSGIVLQVVYADRTGLSNKAITSTSYVDADLNTGLITQKQTGSKIMVVAKVTTAPTGITSSYYRQGWFGFNTTSSGVYSGITSQIFGKAASTSASSEDNYDYPFTVGTWFINTPSSSFTIYLTAAASIANNFYVGGGSYHTSLTVYEIAQ